MNRKNAQNTLVKKMYFLDDLSIIVNFNTNYKLTNNNAYGNSQGKSKLKVQ